MKFSKGLEFAVKLSSISVNALALEIVDLLCLHQDGVAITDRDKFVLGLRYYEFYTDSEDYTLAIKKQEEYLSFLGINRDELFGIVDGIFKDMREEAK